MHISKILCAFQQTHPADGWSMLRLLRGAKDCTLEIETRECERVQAKLDADACERVVRNIVDALEGGHGVHSTAGLHGIWIDVQSAHREEPRLDGIELGIHDARHKLPYHRAFIETGEAKRLVIQLVGERKKARR